MAHRSKWPTVGSKWVSIGLKWCHDGSARDSTVKIGQNWLNIAQNRPKMPQNGPKKDYVGSTAKTQLTVNCDQIPRRGAVWMAYLCGLWAAGHQIWPQRGLKAPFATKFGMDLGVLAVFLGPVCHQMPAA